MALNNSNFQEHEQAWLAAARDELERDAEALDTRTVARLRAARLRALAAQPVRAGWLDSGWLDWRAMAGATLVLALAVGMVWLQQPPLPSEHEAAELMSGMDEGYEFYENLEFYEWLEAQGDEDKRKG